MNTERSKVNKTNLVLLFCIWAWLDPYTQLPRPSVPSVPDCTFYSTSSGDRHDILHPLATVWSAAKLLSCFWCLSSYSHFVLGTKCL